LKELASISAIEPQNVYDTGCKPILVHCSDLEFYVCKYNNLPGPGNKLAREYIVASFLKLWELRVPDFAIVRIDAAHLSNSLGIGKVNTDCPAFGSWYNRNLKEVDRYLAEMSPLQRRKFPDKWEFLAIAFFDLWVSNEDRNDNNYNLLISLEHDGYHFIPIDHASCFHTGTQDKPNYALSREESLLSSPILTKLFKPDQLGDEGFLKSLHEIWYLCSVSCELRLPEIINSLPNEWVSDKENLEQQLKNYIFKAGWFEECWQTFLEYIQMTLNK